MELFDRATQILFFADQRTYLVSQDLRVEELLAVLPFVKCFRFVQTLVALDPDERQHEPRSDGFRKLGFAHAGGTFDEDGLPKVMRNVNRRRDAAARNVTGSFESRVDFVDRRDGSLRFFSLASVHISESISEHAARVNRAMIQGGTP